MIYYRVSVGTGCQIIIENKIRPYTLKTSQKFHGGNLVGSPSIMRKRGYEFNDDDPIKIAALSGNLIFVHDDPTVSELLVVLEKDVVVDYNG